MNLPSWDIRTAVWTMAAARNMPLADPMDNWSPAMAADRMLDAAGIGTDAPRPVEAARGFLFFDENNPGRRESYVFPIADLRRDGTKVVHQAAVEQAMRSLLAFRPVDIMQQAAGQGIIDHYRRLFAAPTPAAPTRAAPPPAKTDPEKPLSYSGTKFARKNHAEALRRKLDQKAAAEKKRKEDARDLQIRVAGPEGRAVMAWQKRLELNRKYDIPLPGDYACPWIMPGR
jgi:hypothetical protein